MVFFFFQAEDGIRVVAVTGVQTCALPIFRKAEAIPYLETTRTMNKYGKIRAVVIESGRDKKRAAIYTNGTAEELGAERIVQLICRRWGEENAIKIGRAHV